MKDDMLEARKRAAEELGLTVDDPVIYEIVDPVCRCEYLNTWNFAIYSVALSEALTL